MIYPLLEKYAAEGRWLGITPQLTASYRVVCPWSAPQFIKARMEEFVSKGVQCLDGYATPSNRFYEFNVAAAAEWSWNVHGRSPREFAAAWATHEGLADPDKAADWATILGPVGWDVYGWRIPFFWVTKGVARMFKKGKQPRLGSSVFTYFPSLKHFDEDLAACDRAMSLARSLGSPEMIEETRVIRGLVAMLKEIYLIAEVTAVGEKASVKQRTEAAEALARLDLASQEVHAGLLSWANAVAPRYVPPRGFAVRFADTVDCLDRVVSETSDALVALGIPDPAGATAFVESASGPPRISRMARERKRPGRSAACCPDRAVMRSTFTTRGDGMPSESSESAWYPLRGQTQKAKHNLPATTTKG